LEDHWRQSSSLQPLLVTLLSWVVALETSDQSLNEDLVLQLSLGSGGLRLAVQVVDHVARHDEGEGEDGQHDRAEEEHLAVLVFDRD